MTAFRKWRCVIGDDAAKKNDAGSKEVTGMKRMDWFSPEPRNWYRQPRDGLCQPPTHHPSRLPFDLRHSDPSSCINTPLHIRRSRAILERRLLAMDRQQRWWLIDI